MNFIQLFAGGQGAQGGGLLAYLPFILILLIMYFLMIRPQAKRQKEKKKDAGSSTKLAVKNAVKDIPNINVQLFSSLKKEGISELCQYLDKIFELNNES